METAAARYRRIRAEKERAEPLHDVTCADCGMEWKARRVGIEFWVSSGILPTSLVETMVRATEKQGVQPEELIKTMAAGEILKSIEFSSKVVRYTAAEPRIVEKPSEPNDISQEEVLTCCYHKLLNWQMTGGDEAARLETFRKE